MEDERRPQQISGPHSQSVADAKCAALNGNPAEYFKGAYYVEDRTPQPRHAEAYWRNLVGKEAVEEMYETPIHVFDKHLDASREAQFIQHLYDVALADAAKALHVMDTMRRLGAQPRKRTL